MRISRSIQAEGSFANIKENMSFRRYLCSGTANVLAESTLLAIAHNIIKFHYKMQSVKIGQQFFELKAV